ncbi:MAG TPA: MFS transporter, partial [Chloroflexota bacterium]|nr:MFS transporter [Chloroflexota bacterium]
PLYLVHTGRPVGLVGLLAGLAAMAALLSRIPLPALYRPGRSRQILLASSAGGMVSSAAMPLMPDIISFTAVLMVNRVASGIATAVYMARYLDLIGEGVDRRRVMGYYGGTQAAGYAASSLFTGLIADFAGFTAAFLFSAATSGLAAALLLGLPNPTAGQREAAPRPATRHAGRLRGWLAGVDDPGLWGVLNINTWNNFFHVINVSFFPVLATAIGMPPAQVGIIRAIYSSVNAVSRPIAGVVMGRLALRQIAYVGIGLQASLLFVGPVIRDMAVFVPWTLAYGFGRAIVVVATSAGLAEEVDDTRVSRGTSTATYSTSSDLSNVGAPLVGGLIASIFGVVGMFPLTAMGFLACFLAGDVTVARWRARRKLPAADAGEPVSVAPA